MKSHAAHMNKTKPHQEGAEIKMNKNDNLGNRMKTYENVTRDYLTRRIPVIIRLDGCHFHTFTKGFDKPFDELFCETMQTTMKYLCENIQNCVLGYTQSDEITLVLCDYKKLDTAAWFDNNIQKICSVSASMASAAFNQAFKDNTIDLMYECCCDPDDNNLGDEIIHERKDDYDRCINIYLEKKPAFFDSRVFNLPKEEVCNCLIWRQQDATRNSIQGLGQKHFSHKELQGKKCNDIQDMLMLEKNINWNNVPTRFKRGSCCIKTENGWIIDNEIPIFTQNRDYIESRIIFE